MSNPHPYFIIRRFKMEDEYKKFLVTFSFSMEVPAKDKESALEFARTVFELGPKIVTATEVKEVKEE